MKTKLRLLLLLITIFTLLCSLSGCKFGGDFRDKDKIPPDFSTPQYVDEIHKA